MRLFSAPCALLLAASSLCSSPLLAADGNSSAIARELLGAAGVRGGLVVHVGCGDGRLTAALRASSKYLVHGLDRDPATIAVARKLLHAEGVGNVVTVELWDGAELPLVGDSVNLIVVEANQRVEPSEVQRVLAPGGVALLRGRDLQDPKRIVKPWPADIDVWTHYLRDATGNAVARDRRVGPPRRMQWIADPLWTRHHHKLASISAVVSEGGRLFYILDEGSPASLDAPTRWSVAARDAFSGVFLWKRTIPTWADHQRGFRSGPVQLPRLLVADNGRVWVTLGVDAPISQLDAATGDVVATIPATGSAEEMVVSDGTLVVLTGVSMSEQAAASAARRRGVSAPTVRAKAIVAIRTSDRAVLWRRELSGEACPVALTLAVAKGSAYYQSAHGVVALDLRTGDTRWESAPRGAAKRDARGKGGDTKQARPKRQGGKKAANGKKTSGKKAANDKKAKKAKSSLGWSVATLVVHDGVVLSAAGNSLRAFAADSGEPLWQAPCRAGFRSPSDVFVVNGLVWLGPAFSEGRALRTGEVKATNDAVSAVWTVGHHHRCYRNKATERFLLTGKRGVEFIDLSGGDHMRHNWIRGVCQYGILPCNGLVYLPSDSCACFVEAKLNGFWAVSATGESSDARAGHPLIRGPAFDASTRSTALGATPAVPAGRAGGDDWPMHRHDASRGGATRSALPHNLDELWRTPIGGRLTAAVSAARGDGSAIAVVATAETHRIVAVDATSGAPRWSFIAGGRVDSPPTLHRGAVLFGCADGWLYSLRLADGALRWRLRVAPLARKAVVRDQIESVWPLHGSVLVQNGIAWVAAGRSSYLDGGFRLFGVDPATGEILHRGRVDDEAAAARHTPRDESGALVKKVEKIDQNQVDAKSLAAPDRSDAFSMNGVKSELLVGDGASVWLRHLRFDAQLRRQETPGRHLFTTSTLLDGTGNHRTHWVLGSGDFRRLPVAYSWIANREGGRGGTRLASPYGAMLCFDETTVWGVREAAGSFYLFAQKRRASTEDTAAPDFRRVAAVGAPRFEWKLPLPFRPRAMASAGGTIIVAGAPGVPPDGSSATADRGDARLWIVSAQDGEKIAAQALASPPVWDGLSVAHGRVLLATEDGDLQCLGRRR